MYPSGKERNDQRNQESNAANQGFHNGPGLEGGFFIHADKALDKPEAGIVKVRADRGTTCDGSGNAGKIQRRQLADAGHGNAAIRALSISQAVMMSSRVTWMPRCAVFSFKISSQCSYCAAVFDLFFPV